MTLEQENALLALITDPLEKINRRAIEEAARQIKKIGTLSAKNIDQLNMQHEAGIAASEIIAAIAREADTTVKRVYDVLEAVAKAEYAASEPLFAFRGIDQVPYENNGKMRRNVRAIAHRTCETMTNISLTRGQSVGLKTVRGFLPLNKAYAQIIDDGIQSVVFGGKSYDEATRETIKTFGGSGLRVQYDSRNTRRIDSAVRMNTLDGIRAVNAEVQAEIADTIRADKVEISVHLPPLYCAPDHLEYQGLVMTRDELDRLNSTTLAYPKRAIAVGALNCRHYTLAFLDGISKPRYTPEQLAEIVRSAKETHEITYTNRFGREQRWTGTLYEATQVQRQMETALRYAKDAHNAAKVAENTTLASELRREITARKKEYESFSGAIGLKAQVARTRVEKVQKPAILGEKDIYAINQYKSAKSYHINAALRGEMPMTETLQSEVDSIDRAIEKLPEYAGTVYRSLRSEEMGSAETFFRKHAPGDIVAYPAFTSSGTEVYDDSMDIQMVIQSKHGHDMRTYNPMEQEVLFRRGSKFIVERREGNTIWLTEI